MSQIQTLFKNVSWVTVSKVITNICAFLWTILIARYLGVSDYGTLSFVISFTVLIGMGTDRVYIVDQEDEIRDVNKGYVKKILGYVFVAIFTGIFAIFNSIITTRMEYELKRKDLTVYRLLGVSRFTILFIQLMEVIVLDAASIAVGVYAAKRLIEYLTLKEILYMTAITQKEIAAMVAFGAVLMLSKIICITLNYHRDERKNVIC